MAGNSFNDFSSLKSLKKELEKNNVAAAPSKAQNVPRNKTVRLKSKDEILGESEDKPVFTNKAVEIDLHIEALPGGLGVAKGQELPYQLEYFRRTLRSQFKHRGSRIIFVQGVGDGVLKAAVIEELDTAYAISCSWSPYGDGATAVTIK